MSFSINQLTLWIDSEEKRCCHVCCKISRALGNQMFEYAFMKSLEKIYPDTIIKGYIGKISDFNGYELDKVFGIRVPTISTEIYMRLSDSIPDGVAFRKIRLQFLNRKKRKFGYKESHIIQGDNSAYYPAVYELNPIRPYLFDGVWANSKHVEAVR